MATYVPAILTPMSFDEAAVAMSTALRGKLGHEPKREVLALALAKSAFECARWKSIYCHNWGNIRPSATDSGLYTCFPICNEILSDMKIHWYAPEGEVVSRSNRTVMGARYETPPGHPMSRFKAWASAAEGAEAYVKFVAGGRYAAAWTLLLAGDAAGYVTELKRKGYFTGPLQDYLSSVVSMQREFISKLTPVVTPPAKPPELLYSTLRRGALGPNVVKMQQALNRHGPAPRVLEDGHFGEKTYIALRVFQQAKKLVADGICGNRTWLALLSEPKT